MSKPILLWVGDAVQPTGFSRVTHNVLAQLHEKWDVHVLGINYSGDPHPYPYPIYPAMLGGDPFGIGRFGDIVRRLNPEVVCILQDPWIAAKYLNTDAPPDVPIVAYMPVDGKNLAMAPAVNGLETAIWYTKFGQYEAERAGFTGRSEIIPHGVDTSMYYPGDVEEARATLGITQTIGKDAFIIGNINRNQPRKRLDLTISAFAAWWHNAGKPSNAYLYLHCSRYDIGYDVVQLARYYGIAKRMIMSKVKLQPGESISENAMRIMYQSLSAQMSTTMGEGWGLTTHEGMACGIPQIVPEWAALSEWCRGAVSYVSIDSYQSTAKGVNVIGGVPSMEALLKAIDRAYRDNSWRKEFGRRALECATREEFQWPSVGREFDRVLTDSKRKEYGNEPTTAAATTSAGQADGAGQQATNERTQEGSREQDEGSVIGRAASGTNGAI